MSAVLLVICVSFLNLCRLQHLEVATCDPANTKLLFHSRQVADLDSTSRHSTHEWHRRQGELLKRILQKFFFKRSFFPLDNSVYIKPADSVASELFGSR